MTKKRADTGPRSYAPWIDDPDPPDLMTSDGIKGGGQGHGRMDQASEGEEGSGSPAPGLGRLDATLLAAMIRIAITAGAFEAICATLPLSSVGYERERTATGGYFIWVERAARCALQLFFALDRRTQFGQRG